MLLVKIKVGNGYDIHALPPFITSEDLHDYFHRYDDQIEIIYDYSHMRIGD